MNTNTPTGLRRLNRASTLVVALLALFAMGLTACGDDEPVEAGDTPTDTSGGGGGLLDEARENGITIGIANERPFGFEEGGEATGEAPELARVIFEELGITDVSFEVQEFGALINGLNADRFDVIAAGMFINPERAQQVAFADPDYCVLSAFAVPEGNPDGLVNYQSVIDEGVTLGVLRGAVEGDYAEGVGVPDDQLSVFDSQADLFDALEAGRVAAVSLTAISVREAVADRDGFEATEGFVPVVDGEEQRGCGAFAFRPEDADFRDAFNDVLHEMQDNGEVLPVIEEFGFTQEEVDAAAELTVEDLAG